MVGAASYWDQAREQTARIASKEPTHIPAECPLGSGILQNAYITSNVAIARRSVVTILSADVVEESVPS